MNYEEKTIHKIKVAIRDIRVGKLAPADAKCAPMLDLIKRVNLPMYEDLINDYKAAVIEYKSLQAN